MASPDLSKLSPTQIDALVKSGRVSADEAAMEIGDRNPDPAGPQAQIGEARINTPTSSAVDAMPPRSDIPLKEPSTLVAAPDEGPRTAFGTQKVIGNNIPRGVGNQYAAGLGLPTEGREAPPAAAADLSGKDAVFDLGGQPAPQPLPSGGDAFAGIDLNAPERRINSSTTVGGAVESQQHKDAMASSNAHLEASLNEEAVRNQHLYQAGVDKANMQQGYADKLQAGNDAYQAKVAARAAEVKRVDGERAAASKAYQDEVKNVPLGTMLNPTTAQAMGSAIAQALGAFGSALSHSPNAALAILDKQLDTAQRERQTQIQGKAYAVRMADKHLQDLRDIYRDDDSAHAAWKADIYGVFASRLERQATLTGNQDIIDAGKVNAEAARQKQDMLNAQAAQHYDKQVQHTTSVQTESGPMVALKAAEARLKAQKDNEGKLPVSYDKYEAWKAKDRAAKEIMAAGAQNIPGAMKRVTAAYGSDIKSWDKAVASGFAGVDLTNQQKDSLSAMYRLMNAQILEQTGKAMSENEASRIKVGLGFADFSNPSDVMRAVRRVGGNLVGDRASMIAANGMYRDVFAAYDATEGARPAGPNGKSYGLVPGQ